MTSSCLFVNPANLFPQGVGEVVAVGPKCSTSVGQAVGYMKNGSFSEYMVSAFLISMYHHALSHIL